jgi:hypothetical protein
MFGTPNLLQYIHKVGYIKFHKCFDSDHRGMYCDLSTHIFDKSKIENNINRKRFVGSNSTNNEGINFAHNINEQLLHHDIYKKREELLLLAKEGKSNKELLLYQLNHMDKFITTTMLNSEIKCCKKKDPVLWTPAVYQSNLRVQYYNIRLKSERHRIYANERIKDIIRNMDDESKTLLRKNNKNMESSFHQAIRDHNKICKNNNIDRKKLSRKIN